MSNQNYFIQFNQLSYALPNGDFLFKGIQFLFSGKKIGLIGRNGIGKSTLLSLISGKISATSGSIQIPFPVYYAEQSIENENQTVAHYLGFSDQFNALLEIEKGNVDPIYFEILDNHWSIREDFFSILEKFKLNHLSGNQMISELSGGERTRLIWAKSISSGAPILLLDEPTNHLDRTNRAIFLEWLDAFQGMLIIASHDRELLNRLETQVEITTKGLFQYGGNYEDYLIQKTIQENAKQQQLQESKRQYQNTLQSMQQSRETLEQKRKYGKALREKGSIDKMQANSKRGQSERTQSRQKKCYEKMQANAQDQLKQIQSQIEIRESIRIPLEKTTVPDYKKVFSIENLTFSHEKQLKNGIFNFSLEVSGAKRIAIVGDNGSYKTTLCQLLTGLIQPDGGEIIWHVSFAYLDQHAECLDPNQSLIDNFLRLQPKASMNDAYQVLAQYLFKNRQAEKPVHCLSGGERLRAALACLLSGEMPPQCLILDEPSNHLDLESLSILEETLCQFSGALIVISHDAYFLKAIHCDWRLASPFDQDAQLKLDSI